MLAKAIESEEGYLQIRRPNRLFINPLKKNLALLLDALGFNFYVKNPKSKEFKMAWVELEREFGINTRNHKHVKAKLQELEKLNYISDLKMWNNGFSYKFENTFLSLDEWLKPATWTFLNFNLMKELNTISYTLYTLAYKYYDFTNKSKKVAPWKNQTKTLSIDEFRKMFNSHSKNNVEYSKNRLLTLVRKAVADLEVNFGVKIDIYLKKFGRPIIGVKFKFVEVPTLKKILSKFIDSAFAKVKKKYLEVKKDHFSAENEFQISAEKQRVENAQLRVFAQQNTLKKFFEDELFPNIYDLEIPELKETKDFILNKFYRKDGDRFEVTLDEAQNIYFKYFNSGIFEKLMKLGAYKDFKFSTSELDGKIQYYLKGVHPLLKNISGSVVLFTVSLKSNPLYYLER